ncbi:MAG: hypothetical protein LRY55_03365, partial [Leadbetterella sp.]|nr:hypothetical protein [Leadbetterella sp.]
MKKRKSLVLAGLLLMSLTSFAQFGPQGGGPPAGEQRRQEPRDPEKAVEEEVRWMQKKLKLSGDQLTRATRTTQKYIYAEDDLRNSLRQGGRPG